MMNELYLHEFAFEILFEIVQGTRDNYEKEFFEIQFWLFEDVVF